MNWYRAKRKSAVLSSSTIKHSSHYFSFFLSVCLSDSLSICFSVSLLSFSLSYCISCLSIFLCLCLFVALSSCPSVFLSLCLFVSLSLCLSFSLSLSYVYLFLIDSFFYCWFSTMLPLSIFNLVLHFYIFRFYVGLRVATLCIWSGNYSPI